MTLAKKLINDATKKKHIKGVRLMRKTMIFMITILVSLAFVQSAFAVAKNRAALSPYFQTDVNSTYSFVGVTHPSLNTAATQIGLTVQTVGLVGATPSTTFTVNAGQTYRIFIVSTNHTTINSDTVTGSRVIFLGTTTGSSTNGHLMFTSNTIDPTVGSRLCTSGAGCVAVRKLEGLNQLSLWGAIVIPATSTGFAMEFIGDAHDSISIITTAYNSSLGGAAATASRLSLGRGVQ